MFAPKAKRIKLIQVLVFLSYFFVDSISDHRNQSLFRKSQCEVLVYERSACKVLVSAKQQSLANSFSKFPVTQP